MMNALVRVNPMISGMIRMMPATLQFDIDENVANITSTAMSSFSIISNLTYFKSNLNSMTQMIFNFIKTLKGNHSRAIILFQSMGKTL